MVKPVIGLFILFILGVGLFFVVSTNFCAVQAAGELPIPSVPEFTLKYVDHSYDVPPVYGIDQFTGKEVITQEGYHVNKRSIEFKIKNQAFTPYNDSSGNEINLYFNFRFKGHFGSDWKHYPFSDGGGSTHRYSTMLYVLSYESPKLTASNTEYTNITLSLPFLFGVNDPAIGSQVDFQVQALIGNIDYVGDGFYAFTGQRSDWSETQTVTIDENTPNTSNEDIPEFPSWITLPLILTITLFLMIAKRKLHQRQIPRRVQNVASSITTRR